MAQDRKTGGGLEESAVRLAFGVFDHLRRRNDERKREEARKAAATERAARSSPRRAARDEEPRSQDHAPSDAVREERLREERIHEEQMREEARAAGSARPGDGVGDRDDPDAGRGRFSFDSTAEFAANASARYGEIRDRAGVKVTEALSKGTAALDRGVGDVPWQILGMDERDTKVAREVMTDVVPDVVGERASAFIDGVALRGGLMGAGAAMRMSLRSFAGPMITGLAAVEAARAVQEIKDRAVDVGVRVDGERPPRR